MDSHQLEGNEIPSGKDHIEKLRDALISAFAWGFTVVYFGTHIAFGFDMYASIAAAPDLNGDGSFTVLDIPQAVLEIVTNIGRQLQIALANTELGSFFEMSAASPSIFWSLVLTVVCYIGPYVALFCIGAVLAESRSK